MFFKLLKYLFKDFYIFSAAYSNNVFPDPLTEEDEKYYLEKCLMGDKEARAKLIEHNLRLVAHIVKKYDHRNEDMDDLLSIGTIGLIKGVDSYTIKHGTRLTTYVAKCIENEILMFLRKSAQYRCEVSFDEPLNVDWDGNELLLSDILGTDEDIVSRGIEWEAECEPLMNAVNSLPDREREIMELRFGLGGRQALTQKEVADKIGISQSYISRLEKKIIKKLRVVLEEAV